MGDRFGVNSTVAALAFGRLVEAIGNGIMLVLLPPFVAALPTLPTSLPETVLIGIVISLYGMVFTFLQPVAAIFADRIPRRKPMILAGLLVMGSASAGYALTGRYIQLLVLRMFQGMALAVIIASSLALLASETKADTRGSAIGIYDSMRMIGLGLGPLIGGLLQVNFGFDTAFYAGAVAALIGAALVYRWVQETKPGHNPPMLGSSKLFDRSLLTPNLLGLGLATTLVAVIFITVTTLENVFNARLEQTSFGFGFALSMLTFSRLLVQVPLGRLSDHIGRKPLILAGLLLLVPSTALMAAVTTTWQLAALMAMLGISTAAIASPAYALAADQSEAGSEGRRMSIVTLGFGIGMMGGPLFAGTLASASFVLPFALSSFAALLGAWFVHNFVHDTPNVPVSARDIGQG